MKVTPSERKENRLVRERAGGEGGEESARFCRLVWCFFRQFHGPFVFSISRISGLASRAQKEEDSHPR